MERAIRVVSVERGHDPREFALLAFGGAGGMHACEIAATLDIATVIVPRHAGVLSALGMLLADVTKDYSPASCGPATTLDAAELDGALRAARGRRPPRDLAAKASPAGAGPRSTGTLDVRYVGQSYEITLPCRPSFRDAFDRRHAALVRLRESDARRSRS